MAKVPVFGCTSWGVWKKKTYLFWFWCRTWEVFSGWPGIIEKWTHLAWRQSSFETMMFGYVVGFCWLSFLLVEAKTTKNLSCCGGKWLSHFWLHLFVLRRYKIWRSKYPSSQVTIAFLYRIAPHHNVLVLAWLMNFNLTGLFWSLLLTLSSKIEWFDGRVSCPRHPMGKSSESSGRTCCQT